MKIINHLLQKMLNGEADRQVREARRGAAKASRVPSLNQPPDEATLLGDTIPSALQALRQGGRAESVPLTISSEERARHLYILGKTGSGKSVLQLSLFLHEARAGRALVLIDARGDLFDKCLLTLRSRFFWPELSERLILLDFRERAPYQSPNEPVVGMNPLTQTSDDPYICSAFVMDLLRQEWGDAVGGVQIQESLRHTLLALAVNGETILAVEPFLTIPAFRKTLLARVTDPSTLRFFARFDALGPAQGQWVNPVLNKLTWASRPGLRRIFGQQNGLSFRRLFEERPDVSFWRAWGRTNTSRRRPASLGRSSWQRSSPPSCALTAPSLRRPRQALSWTRRSMSPRPRRICCPKSSPRAGALGCR